MKSFMEFVPRSHGLADWFAKHSEWVLRFSTASITRSVFKEGGTLLTQFHKFTNIVLASTVFASPSLRLAPGGKRQNLKASLTSESSL